ncbi:heterogeneous nuclear ribonucleoprotein 1-like [Phoenix dactylifera]|uniref:Heterogeneous nuclear ribonucleoprotein 1-like n=1 Tax=Phoenix dactylifera TaxID=42345 RepID=A0A8B9AKW9_PHODC|nr:heterogeneous nuclear ribonucleoprotein 1-like [Phoenix dactylifera]XP_038986338.1 heterogeneous nuclear ribonucleoprotein 1-like [Phoenix dactylifera]
MEVVEEMPIAVSGVDEVEEEVEQEVEEVEEEVEEQEEGGRDGEGEVEEGRGEEGGAESPGRGIEMVDSAGEEIKQPDSSSSSSGKIFVGGVAWDTTEETFTEHFEKYGEITDSVIMKDKHTHMPRGFGFVTFADSSVIDKVLEDEHVIDGRTVEVKRTVPREEMPSKAGLKTKKIFVGGIPPSLTEDELKEHFALYGEVVEHQIMLDHSTGRSRGFGFVTFENEEAVEKIISEGRMHDLGGKQVEIKRAEPRKAGGDPGTNGRGARGTGGGGAVRGNHRGGGGAYGYGGGYRSSGVYYGGSYGYGYGRGYGYGAAPSFGAGFSSSYGGPMYGNGGYGSSTAYGGPAGYNGVYGGYGAGRGYGNRYHPYGK